MLYNITTGWGGITKRPMSEIVILVSSLLTLVEQGIPFLFSNQHASLVKATFSNNLGDLDRLDWKIWQARDFQRNPNDPDKLARYQAEALAYRHVPASALQGIVCHGTEQETVLTKTVHNSRAALTVMSRPAWYV